MKENRTTDGRRLLVVLLLGDWLGLALFVLLGHIDHEMLGTYGLTRLLTTTLALALPWILIAALLGAYQLSPQSSARAFLGRSLNAWLVSAPLGLLLRAQLLGQPTIIVIFFVVTLGLGGLFLLLWRALFYFLWKRQSVKAPSG